MCEVLEIIVGLGKSISYLEDNISLVLYSSCDIESPLPSARYYYWLGVVFSLLFLEYWVYLGKFSISKVI